MMKHLLTLTALLVSSLAMAQMPYNPDSNGDDLIGSEDLLTFLGVYNTTLMQPDLQCDYEGTELEQLFVGAITGGIQIDSVYVEYLLLDTMEYFTPGCPDLVVDPLVLERSYILYPEYFVVDDRLQMQTEYFNYERKVTWHYEPMNNGFSLQIIDEEVSATMPSYYTSSSSGSTLEQLPFPENWTLDENGMQVSPSGMTWVSNCEHFRVIPYWSEAE